MRKLGAATALVVAAAAGLTACVPEPTTSPSATADATAPAPAPSATSTPTPTPTPTAGPIALPADCAEAYSPAMSSTMAERNLPLNAAGIELLSTQQAPLLELLSESTTLRCTWGAPGTVGLSTNITEIDAATSSRILDVLAEAGFGCAPEAAGTVCRIEQRGVDFDGNEYTRGEEHVVADGVWLASGWVNVDLEGYSADILQTLARG